MGHTLVWRPKYRGNRSTLIADVDDGQYLVSRYYGPGNAWEARWNDCLINLYDTRELAKSVCQDHNDEREPHALCRCVG